MDVEAKIDKNREMFIVVWADELRSHALYGIQHVTVQRRVIVRSTNSDEACIDGGQSLSV